MFEPMLGATYLGEQRYCFRAWAPLLDCVEVHLVAPTDRRVVLTRGDDGYHHAILDDVPAGSLYFYGLPDGKERPDPASRHQPLGVHGPSQVVVDDHLWHDETWPGLPLSAYIIYELHVGTFTPEGTFDAIIPRLDALAELGVTALELMPIAQFPGSRNWGYDGAYVFAAQSTYGGPAGLRRLVDACHQRGLAVILDVVYNHLGPEGNYLGDFAPYFTQRYHTDWGSALNFDGPYCDGVRRYFLENALYWLRNLHIDALRLDAVNMIQDLSAKHFLEELAEQVDHHFPAPWRRHLIAESLLDDPKMIRPRAQHGNGMDAQWCDDFHHALHAALTGERNGYYQDYGSLEQLALTYRQGYRWTGQYCAYRQRRVGRTREAVGAEQFVIYAQNHDQVGNRKLGERLSQLLPFEALKLVAAAVILSPNIPLLFMGEEYGDANPFAFFISHGDPDLVEAVRAGRKHEFTAFQWLGEIPDPQDEATFRRSHPHWQIRDVGQHRLLLDFHRELIRLRKAHPALRHLSFDAVEATADEPHRLLHLRRKHASASIHVLFHFGARPTPIPRPLPLGRWRTLLDSSLPRWGGAGSALGAFEAEEGRWEPYQVVVLADAHEPAS